MHEGRCSQKDMDYEPRSFPIERDEAPSDHYTYADGVSRAGINGAVYKELWRENKRRTEASKHCRQSHTA